jgi:hypothetical protein
MASALELIAALKGKDPSGRDYFPAAATLIESYGAVARDQLLADSVNQATADGVSIVFKGFNTKSTDPYPGTYINSITMPQPSAYPSTNPLTAAEAMTYFLFETRNAMRAKKYCEVSKKVALSIITSDEFAWKFGEFEARGGLEIGRMWKQISDRYGSSKLPSSGLAKYHYDLYVKTPNWETDVTQLNAATNSILSETYKGGDHKGRTRQWYYLNILLPDRLNPKYFSYFAQSTCSGSALVASTTVTSPIGIA